MVGIEVVASGKVLGFGVQSGAEKDGCYAGSDSHVAHHGLVGLFGIGNQAKRDFFIVPPQRFDVGSHFYLGSAFDAIFSHPIAKGFSRRAQCSCRRCDIAAMFLKRGFDDVLIHVIKIHAAVQGNEDAFVNGV